MVKERCNGESGSAALRLLAGLFIGGLLLTPSCSTVDVSDPDWPEAHCPADQDEVIVTIPSGGTYSVEVVRVFERQVTMAELYREGIESGIGDTPREVKRNARHLQPDDEVTVCL